MKSPLTVSLKRRQQGAHTVEFMLTLMLFLLVFLTVIEFAIVVYDRGTVNNTVRWGSRQASLFWIDPNDLQLLEDGTIFTVPPRTKHAFVDSVRVWTEQNLLIDPSNLGMNVAMQVVEADGSITDVTIADPVADVSNVATVRVDVDYAHQYLAIAGFGFVGLALDSQSSAGME